MDGNGRSGRTLYNAALVSRGIYPLVLNNKERREKYLDLINKAHIYFDENLRTYWNDLHTLAFHLKEINLDFINSAILNYIKEFNVEPTREFISFVVSTLREDYEKLLKRMLDNISNSIERIGSNIREVMDELESQHLLLLSGLNKKINKIKGRRVRD